MSSLVLSSVQRQLVLTSDDRKLVLGVPIQVDAVGGTGEANTATNVGAGDANVFRDKTGVTLNLRTVSGIGGVTVTENGDVIEISATGTGGDVAGPAGATDEAVAVFDGITGKAIKESGATIDAGGNLATPGTVDGRDVSADGATLDGHVANTSNPHSTDIGNLGTGTLAELNSKVVDATLDDSGDARTPTSHGSTHENGGADEISVAGLSGALADPQTPTTHAATHKDGGADEVATGSPGANLIPKADVSGKLDPGWLPSLPPSAHNPTHEVGGSDEISIAGLTGVAATPQTPASHASTHENGGADEISVLNLSGLLADPQTPTSHASTHEEGGSDSLQVEDLTTGGAVGTVPTSNGVGGLTMQAAVTTDQFVAVDASDTTPGFLDDKVQAGDGLTRTIINPGADEDYRLDVAANADGSIVANTNDIQVGVLATDAQHGNLGGGTLHPAATPAASGFMSAADKTILDNHVPGTNNPHATDIGNLGTGTLAELNSKVVDATLDDSGDPRTPTAHAATHQNGGSDEINVGGLSGLLADGQTPLAHASTHEDGGLDELDVTGLSGVLADDQNPAAHASTHQNGGLDELNVGGLSGLLADGQTPLPHQATHHDGQPDQLSHTDLADRGINAHTIIDSHIVTANAHFADTANPHSTDIGNLGAGTLAELNVAVTDATLDDSGDPREDALLRQKAGSGLLTGGTFIPTGGVGFTILAGSGLINDGTETVEVTWASPLVGAATLPGANYISVDKTGSILITSGYPYTGAIYIALLYVDPTISVIIGLSLISKNYFELDDTFWRWARDAVGPLVESGCTVSEQAPPNELKISVASGAVYSQITRLTVADTTDLTKIYDTADNDFVQDTSNPNEVSTTQWNDATQPQVSALVNMTTDYWKKDVIVLTPSSGTIFYVYAQSEWATEEEALEAPNPAIPDAATSSGAIFLAAIVCQEGDTSIANRLVDIRPILSRVFGTGTTGSAGTVVNHQDLFGRDAVDAHSQYQLTSEKNVANGYAGLDGSTKLTGSQQVYGAAANTAVEGNDTRVPTQDENDALVGTDGTPSTANPYVTDSDSRLTDARTPVSHAATHVPGAGDALATAAVGSLGAGDVAAEGVAASFARSDHVHGAFGAGTLAELVKDPTGFEDLTQTTITFDPSPNRRFTIAPVAASFDFYIRGEKFTKTGAETVDIANTTGLWFIYYDNTGTLTASLTPWTFTGEQAFVAIVYWNIAQPTQEIMGDERHGLAMSWATHGYLHETRGTQYMSGFGISGFVLDSATDADVTIGLEGGTIADEDIIHQIVQTATPTNPFEQDLADPAQIPVYHRAGAGGPWVKDAATDFYFKNVVGGTARVAYNSESGGSWAQTEVANNDFVAAWIFATNNLLEPIVAVQGQREDGTLSEARASNGFESLNLGSLPGTEWKILYRIMLQTGTGLGGTRKARVEAVDDFRATTLQPGEAATATNHGSLSGLTTSDDHTQYQLRSEKSLASGYASLDITTKVPIAELPTAAPAQGVGGGNSEGTATSVARSDHDHAIRTTTGPTDLTVGAVADGQFLQRSGTAIVGNDPVPTGYTAAEALARTTTTGEDVTKLSITTPAATGTFLLWWGAVVDASNRVAELNLYDVTGATEIENTSVTPASGDLHPGGGRLYPVVLTGTARTYEIRFGNEPGRTFTIGCQNARMHLWRVA